MTGGTHRGLTRNEGLDALRVLAAGSVLLSHAFALGGIGWVPIPTGTMGVGMFFVLSGYLIADQLMRHPEDVRGFWIRRGARIFPAYWLAVVVIGLVTASPSFAADPLGYLTMTHAMDDDMLIVAWTLQVEIMFYAIAPLIVPLRTRWWLALGVASFAIAVAAAVAGDQATLGRTLPANLWRFLPGMLVARYAGRALPWQLALPLLAVPIVVGDGPVGLHVDPFTAVAGGILVASVVARPGLQIRGAAAGAALSYAVYLWQFDVLSRAPTIPVGIVMVIAIAAVSFRLVERPAMRWASRVTRLRADPGQSGERRRIREHLRADDRALPHVVRRVLDRVDAQRVRRVELEERGVGAVGDGPVDVVPVE